MPRLSLMEALAAVPDPRSPRGRRHPFLPVLALTVVALLAGMKSLEAIAQFGRARARNLALALGFPRTSTPTKSCLAKIFRRLDVAALEAALSRWIHSRLQDDWAHIAIDGKTARGSADDEVPGVHLLAAFVPAVAATIAQLRVDGKTNEHKAALQLLGVLPMAGKVVSGDAMFTHRDVAQAIRAGGGDYLLVVKDNQPELVGHIQAALHDDAAFSPLPGQAQGGAGAAGHDNG